MCPGWGHIFSLTLSLGRDTAAKETSRGNGKRWKRILFDRFDATNIDQYVRDGKVCGDISIISGTFFPVVAENDMTTMTPTNLKQDTVLGESSRIIPRKVSFLDWGNMDHPESFGTYYRNGTFTLQVNGLSLEKSWFDPRKVLP